MVVLSLLITLLMHVSEILGAFFTMRHIVVKVRHGTPQPFLYTHLLLDNGTESTESNYRLDRSLDHILINTRKGFFSLQHDYKGVGSFSFHLEAMNSQEGTSRMGITVDVLPYSNPCLLETKEICFWDSIEYQIFENRNQTLLGNIGPGTTCKGQNLSYSILNGSQFMEVRKDKLWSKGGLDREITPELFIEISCRRNHNEIEKKVVRVILLDEDDNPPYIQSGFVDLFVNNHQIEKGDIVALDRDLSETGKFSVSIIGDELHILKVKPANLSAPLFGISGTALHCKIRMLESARLTMSPYNVTLRINNTSLLPGNGKSHVDMSVRMFLVQPRALSLSADTVTYEETTVTMVRNSASLARVTQPKEARTLSGEGEPTFSMKHSIFNVTYRSGIVYVFKPKGLLSSSNKTNVTVTWRRKVSAQESVNITILLDPPQNCKENKDDWPMCSENHSAKGCNNTCGLGVGRIKKSGKGRCEMRGTYDPLKLSTDYRTCTVDATTCPDGWCDPLEELNFRICPQDCTQHLFGSAIKNPTGEGISSSSGICTCDQANTCTCLAMGIKGQKKTTTEPNSSLMNSTKNSSSILTVSTQPLSIKGSPTIPPKCDGLCKAGVVGGSLVLSALLATVLLLCRRGKLGKVWRRREIKIAESASSIQAQDHGLQSADTLLLSFNEITPTPSDANLLMLDPKFEFPRSQLIIQQCLGEGEFGRVLRATAKDIGGSPGLTTVAVKTLKENSNPSELADLLSEYQMLKEVSHPNVIKLLGASTIPGGPVYLIMEFAEEGSLRNYLRRSRHLSTNENHSQHKSNAITPPSNVEPITPHDILSFSWQIAKGMAYLTEMKLVHRDLAARNVLVAAGKVCKVSDFGLTRDVYEDDAYLKRSKGRVPVKWMALESLADHVYTTKTDVWSFGVLLWELVTLGASPYPGVAVHNLFHLLRAGYRMEKPENCSHQLYSLMRSCWMEEPIERPTFKHLTSTFEKMLEDGTEYLNLELRSRIAINRAYFTEIPPQDDFENQIALFDYKVPPSRHNVNGKDKLPMNSKIVFPEENEENNSYMNSKIAVHYENDKVSTEDQEEKYESPVRVINTTLSTQLPSTYLSMGSKQVEQ